MYIDANVLVMSVLDGTRKGSEARMCLRLIDEGAVEALTSALTLDEFMWGLIKANRRDLITNTLYRLYESRIKILPVSSQAPLKACSVMDQFGLDPRDAIHAAVMRENHLTEIISEDKHFDKIAWVKRYSIAEFLGKYAKE